MDVGKDGQVEGGEDDEEVVVDDCNEEQGEEDMDNMDNMDNMEGNVDNAKKKGGRYSKNVKSSVPAKSTNISFYPGLWHKLLNLAKAHM